MSKHSRRSSTPSAERPSKPANFGDVLRAYRERAGYSQAYLAERAQVSVETIGALERGVRRAPYPGTLELLIRALALTGDDRTVIEAAATRSRSLSRDDKGEKLARAHNLPHQLTQLVGREADIARVLALVAQRRLVTVTGPSGVGKTRVALEVAARHAQSGTDHVGFVDFAALDANASVAGNILSALGKAGTSAEPVQELGRVLKARRMLLLLDGCEHVMPEVGSMLLSLLGTCPELRVLVASSEPVRVVAETLFRLTALSVPDHIPASVDEARTYPALRLFFERSGAEMSSGFGVDNLQRIVEICRRLDGNPRAIELAATRLAALGLENLDLRLNERFVLSGGGRDLSARKQMPREAIGLSYGGLTAHEQALFRRLAIFSAGQTLEDAEAVCADESLTRARVAIALDSLVHKSLVEVEHSGKNPRYRVFDLMRSYGLEKLAEAGELDGVSKRYARRFDVRADEADVERDRLKL